MYVQYRVIYKFDKETGEVCAEIPALNYISDSGRNFKEAERNIKKAVSIFLEHLTSRSMPIPPETGRTGTFIRVPFPGKAAV
jgi:predicted RNase H-like HicB family nuclease